MLKTEFYIAGGNKNQMSTKLDDCIKLCEIEGVLYDCNENIERWISETSEVGFTYTKRTVMQQKDLISPNGVIRRVIFTTKAD